MHSITNRCYYLCKAQRNPKWTAQVQVTQISIKPKYSSHNTSFHSCSSYFFSFLFFLELLSTSWENTRLCPGLELGHNPFLPFFYTPIESWITSLRDQAITQWLPEAIASDTWEPISLQFCLFPFLSFVVDMSIHYWLI